MTHRFALPIALIAVLLPNRLAAQTATWAPPSGFAEVATGTDLASAAWLTECVGGQRAPEACTTAAQLAASRVAWQQFTAGLPTAASPYDAIAAAEAAAVQGAESAADACGVDVPTYVETVRMHANITALIRRYDALRTLWLAAAESLLVWPEDTPIDELTGLFGIGAYCDADTLHSEGRWGYVNIAIGDHRMCFYQNPLERLLMCSNFLSIVTLRVSETSPELLFRPLASAGLLAAPYGSMGIAGWVEVQSSPEWAAMLDGIPPDRIWWEMVDHADEQLRIWNQALDSGFIDAPAALLYGARSLNASSRVPIGRALAEPPDLAGVDTTIDRLTGLPGEGVLLLDAYRELAGAFSTGDEDPLTAILSYRPFRDMFIESLIYTGRHAAEERNRAHAVHVSNLHEVASRLERELACAAP